MSQYNFDSLRSVSASTADIVDGQPQTDGPVVAWFEDFRGRIADAISATQALASMQAASGAPANRQGGIWHDTANNKWFGDPDGEGADDDFMNRTSAKGVLFATGGTGTIKPMGVINVDTTLVGSPPGFGAADLITYTVPANTMNTDGNILRIKFWGTKGGTLGSVNFFVKLGSVTMSGVTAPSGMTVWEIEALIIRTGSSSADGALRARYQGDGISATSAVQVEGLSNFNAAIDQDARISITSGYSDTIFNEGMTVELLN